MKALRRKHEQMGFSLLELSIVLLLVGLLLGGLLMPLAQRNEQERLTNTRTLLQDARTALLGYLTVNGRLPCPANGAAGGIEQVTVVAPREGGNCLNYLDGFLPGAALGMTGLDAQGYVLDGWGQRVRYAVTSMAGSGIASSFPFTTFNPGAVNGVFNGNTLAALNANLVVAAHPGLVVCSTASGMKKGGGSQGCANSAALNEAAVALVWSSGFPELAPQAADADGNENLDGDRFYVSHDRAETGADGGQFGQQLLWLSLNEIAAQLAAAGRL